MAVLSPLPTCGGFWKLGLPQFGGEDDGGKWVGTCGLGLLAVFIFASVAGHRYHGHPASGVCRAGMKSLALKNLRICLHGLFIRRKTVWGVCV